MHIEQLFIDFEKKLLKNRAFAGMRVLWCLFCNLFIVKPKSKLILFAESKVPESVSFW